MEKSPVSEYYRGKTILVTGGSGSIGSVLIWKLLRSCSELDTIFLLIRPKKGKNVESRLNDLLQTPIFDILKKENPQLLAKVKAMPGDFLEDRLGLTECDEEKLVNSVQIIFHVAAIVKFDLTLKCAVDMNVRGTQRLLDLGTRMPHLEAFVHTSTAYCLYGVPELGEKLYRAEQTPQYIMDLVTWMKPEVMSCLEKNLIKPHPNTYTYSKRLAEKLVADYYPKVSVAIARPTIASPSLSEPIPGWSDSINNSVMGMTVAMGKGILRVTIKNKRGLSDMIPIDCVCNSLIVTAWKTGRGSRNPREIPVYNVGALGMERLTQGEIMDWGIKTFRTYPYSMMMWYPLSIYASNLYTYAVLAFFLHWIPAYVIDAILFVLGQKTFMVRLQRRVHRGALAVSPFVLREWDFVKTKLLQLREELSVEGRNTFEVTCSNIELEDYFRNTILVARWNIMKEDFATLPVAIFRLKLFYLLHCFIKLCFWLLVGWIALRQLNFYVPTLG